MQLYHINARCKLLNKQTNCRRLEMALHRWSAISWLHLPAPKCEPIDETVSGQPRSRLSLTDLSHNGLLYTNRNRSHSSERRCINGNLPYISVQNKDHHQLIGQKHSVSYHQVVARLSLSHTVVISKVCILLTPPLVIRIKDNVRTSGLSMSKITRL